MGLINIDKPLGWTSSDVVRKLKFALVRAGYPRKVKVGHAGTLDPLATGVLIVCTEKDTKRAEEIQRQRKEYVFTIELGATTISYDLEHPISQRFDFEHITKAMLSDVLETFRGQQAQLPPLFSAKRVDGKRAYDIARDGKTVELTPAPIEIYDIELLAFELPHATIRVECSKGTYIRSLARDIGQALGSGAHLTELRRTKSGEFEADSGLSVEAALEFIEQNPYIDAQ